MKTAALMQSLAENQPFADGNKRTAWICGKLFLQLHGLNIHATTEDDSTLFTERIVNGMTVPELADWIDGNMSALFVSNPAE